MVVNVVNNYEYEGLQNKNIMWELPSLRVESREYYY